MMSNSYPVVVVIAAVLLPLVAIAQIQMGNTFPEGVRLVAASTPCNNNTVGLLRLAVDGRSLELCTAAETPSWSQFATVDPSAMRDTVLCYGHGEFSPSISSMGSSTCVCFDDARGHFIGAHCHQCHEAYSGDNCDELGAWFTLRSNDGTNSARGFSHHFGVTPDFVQAQVRAVDGPNAGFVFPGAGSSMNDDDYSNSYYGGILYGYDGSGIRVWAPTPNNSPFVNGYIINVFDGWGGEVNAQQSSVGEVRVVATPTLQTASDFSTSRVMRARGSNSETYQVINHGLDVAEPYYVRVMVESPSTGYLFPGAGSAQADDDFPINFGGVVFAYSKDNLYLWAPGVNNAAPENVHGMMLSISDGWGGQVNAESHQQATVRVDIWSTGPAPDFDSGWFTFASQAGAQSFAEIPHGLGQLPMRVRVLVRQTSTNIVFEGIGMPHASEDKVYQYGGVAYAFDDSRVRLWAPEKNTQTNADLTGRLIFIGDGWGNNQHSVSIISGDVKIQAWLQVN